ncbi:MAG: DUF58 domain-containing protein [Candidatus Omnitrophica bacterium]|nr:DUF58 domain-containing protein [Candidatus Omnitrophota bacterium]
MPTERAKLLFFMLGLSLIIAWVTQFELIYLISGILGSILFISFIIFHLSLLNINCWRQLPKAVYEDEIIKVKVALRNRGFFPNFFVYLLDNFPAEEKQNHEKRILFPHLPRKRLINWEYEALCYKRGVYWIGPFTLISSDPLGLFKKLKILNIASKLTVYPKIFKINYLPTFIKGMITPRYGAQTVRKSGDYEEFYGIREYRQEDGLRKIHWPLSAKHNQLMVRHFEQSSSKQVTIALDLNKESNLGEGKQTTLEYSIKIAASLSQYFLDRGATVQIMAWSEKPVMTTSERHASHFFTILEVLAQVQADGYYPLDKALLELNPLIPPNSTLIVLALDKDHLMLKSIERFIYAKNASVVYMLMDSASFDKNAAPCAMYFPQVRRQDIKVYYIKREDNLEAKFSSG